MNKESTGGRKQRAITTHKYFPRVAEDMRELQGMTEHLPLSFMSPFLCILCVLSFLSYRILFFMFCSTSTFLCQSSCLLLLFSTVFSCFSPHSASIPVPLLTSFCFSCLPHFFCSFQNLSFSPSPPAALCPLHFFTPLFIFLTLLHSYTPPFGRAGSVVDARGGLEGVKAES